MVKGLSAFVTLALIGCAPPGGPLYVGGGSDAHQVGCSGQTWNWSTCVEKASALCTNSGYTVVAQKEEWAPGQSDNASSSDALAPTTAARTLLIKCHKASV